MFAVMIGSDGYITEIEMHFYTKQAPPFLPEILTDTISGASTGWKIKALKDTSKAGFFDVEEFFQSITARPLITVKMDE
jgi:hypothetical protein